MPIYEYICPKCRGRMETINPFGKKVYCKCGHEMKKLMSTPAFKVYTK